MAFLPEREPAASRLLRQGVAGHPDRGRVRAGSVVQGEGHVQHLHGAGRRPGALQHLELRDERHGDQRHHALVQTHVLRQRGAVGGIQERNAGRDEDEMAFRRFQ